MAPLRFDWNALCSFEAETGESAFAPALVRNLTEKASTLRALYWAGQLHAEKPPTIMACGKELAKLDRAAVINAVLDALSEGLKSGDEPAE